ncbi:MAG: glycosyltransferase [Armatimonadia bacterium]|nr:glycosyltransferase [Armatimonadia bacterium]
MASEMVSLCVIVPAFDEEATIGDIVSRCLEVPVPGISERQVIVIDDGSHDRTADLAQATGARVIRHESNRGVGAAFQTGLRAALESGADMIVNIDGDGQFEPERIPDLIAPILERRADFTTASRFKDPKLVPEMPRVKRWGNRLMSRLISRVARQRFWDVSCGFRAYSREAALKLNLWGGFTYTQESILDLVVKGMRLQEVPMAVRGVREHGESRVAASVWRYAFRATRIIFNSYRDYWPMSLFGWLSVLGLVPGSALVGFLLVHRFTAGAFSPHIWAGFTGGALLGMGFLVLTTGLVAQMLQRIRLNQEEILYFHRSARSDRAAADVDARHP